MYLTSTMSRLFLVTLTGAALLGVVAACSPADQPAPIEDCSNNRDDDGDGLVDCLDTLDCCEVSTCAQQAQCQLPPEVCLNGLDDDGDGAVDCSDTDCSPHRACLVEVCANGLDDDLDGRVDCADLDCVCQVDVIAEATINTKADSAHLAKIDVVISRDGEAPADGVLDVYARDADADGTVGSTTFVYTRDAAAAEPQDAAQYGLVVSRDTGLSSGEPLTGPVSSRRTGLAPYRAINRRGYEITVKRYYTDGSAEVAYTSPDGGDTVSVTVVVPRDMTTAASRSMAQNTPPGSCARLNQLTREGCDVLFLTQFLTEEAVAFPTVMALADPTQFEAGESPWSFADPEIQAALCTPLDCTTAQAAALPAAEDIAAIATPDLPALCSAGDCDDGNPCNGVETCADDVCVSAAPFVCHDDDPCTADHCEPSPDGRPTCSAPPVRCFGGRVCNPDTGACEGSTCVDDPDCEEDDDLCTDAVCADDGGCINVFNTAPCDDDDVCTIDDGCRAGVCVGSTLDCDDDNPCTDDACEADVGCTHDNNMAACFDGDPCTVDDACVDGTCTAGSPRDCDDGDPCTEDGCDESGCINEPLAGLCCSATADCDDGNSCTIDNCVNGLCNYAPNPACDAPPPACVCPDDGDPCTADVCVANVCIHPPLDCDDGDECTADACVEGVCEHIPLCPHPANVLSVKWDATGASNGTSWADAFTELQAALSAAQQSDGTITEIWVAAGLYLPDYDVDGGLHNGIRSMTFQLLDGVALYGGFVGTETSRDQRGTDFTATVLSGDLLGDDGAQFANTTDNSFHVVTGTGTDTSAVMDGFRITGGNASGGFPHNNAGGLRIENGSPRIANCVFDWNSCSNVGGAVLVNETASPTFSDCIFDNNRADSGGAVFNFLSSPTFSGCTFTNNDAVNSGGAMQNNGSPVLVSNSRFAGNFAAYSGGAVLNGGQSAAVHMANCSFLQNSAGLAGGAVINVCQSNCTIVNGLFSRNSADAGGAIYNDFETAATVLSGCTVALNVATLQGGGIVHAGALDAPACEGSTPSLLVTNSILWGNTASGQSNEIDQLFDDSENGQTIVRFSLIQGLDVYADGPGNLDGDPLFSMPASDNFRLCPDSSCIDKGNNADVPADLSDVDGDGDTTEPVPLDLEGSQRVQGGTINMGALETVDDCQ